MHARTRRRRVARDFLSGVLEGASPLLAMDQSKISQPLASREKDAVMEKYSAEGLIGLDPVALAHQLCIIDLSMLKEIRCVFPQEGRGHAAITLTLLSPVLSSSTTPHLPVLQLPAFHVVHRHPRIRLLQ